MQPGGRSNEESKKNEEVVKKMKNEKVAPGRIIDPRGLVVLRSPSVPSIDALLSALATAALILGYRRRLNP